ncbi:endo alpha-1,4 polygalactosaminidase [Streptomyces thermolineatus]|uniref:endo alpha-1,4 polygalactosaminidase n=1 Tax=Streptomyces thermolineatus TaxID=44033 RepID=UPI00384E5233
MQTATAARTPRARLPRARLPRGVPSAAGAAVLATVVLAPTACAPPSAPAPAVVLPPAGAVFDYQLGGAYPPPAGTEVVARDRAAEPAEGLYNICYVNAFQAQPGKEDDWDHDLVLRDGDGRPVVDEDWDEALLDISTPGRRARIAERVDRWTAQCADKGYDAVEPDNYDSYTRSGGRLTAAHARAMITLISRYAHERGLAVAQKNTPELAAHRADAGLDFAVAEECARYDECDVYTEEFGDDVIVVEYTDAALADACRRWGGTLSIVRRDLGVTAPDSGDHVRRTCPGD